MYVWYLSMWGPQWKQKPRAHLLLVLVVKWQSLLLRKGQSMSAKLVAKSVWKHIKHALGMHVCLAPGKPSYCLQISWSPRSPPKSQQSFFPGTYSPLHSFTIFMMQFSNERERERERERESVLELWWTNPFARQRVCLSKAFCLCPVKGFLHLWGAKF
jgi:hypothetical protein